MKEKFELKGRSLFDRSSQLQFSPDALASADRSISSVSQLKAAWESSETANEPIGRSIEEVLADLEDGHRFDHASVLANHDDPRLRPALISALTSAAADKLRPLAATLGRLGGEGALEALHACLTSLRQGEAREKDTRSQARVAQAILSLDPDCTEASDILIDLLDGSIGAVAKVLAAESRRPPMLTQAHQRLRVALRQYSDGANVRQFCIALPALVQDNTYAALSKCADLLTSSERTTRERVGGALSQLIFSASNQSVLVVLRSWLEEEADVRLLLECARPPAVSTSRAESIIRSGLGHSSPSIRDRAAKRLVEELTPASGRRLLKEALLDEPDPFLRDAFGRLLQSLEGSPGG